MEDSRKILEACRDCASADIDRRNRGWAVLAPYAEKAVRKVTNRFTDGIVDMCDLRTFLLTECFLAVPMFDPARGTIGAFLFTTCRNRGHSWWKREHSAKRRLGWNHASIDSLRDDGLDAHSGDMAGSAILADPGTVEVGMRLENRELWVRILRELDLTDLEREVFFRRMKGEEYQDVADAMGRDYKCIDNTVERIRDKLEPIMERLRVRLGADGVAVAKQLGRLRVG